MGEKHRKLYIIKCRVCGNRKRRAVPYALYCSEKCAHIAQRRNRAKREADQVNAARAAQERAQAAAERETKRQRDEAAAARIAAEKQQLAQELRLWIPRCECGAQDWRLTWWQGGFEGLYAKRLRQYTMICQKCKRARPSTLAPQPCRHCEEHFKVIRQEFYLNGDGTLKCAAGFCAYVYPWRHWKVIPVIVKKRSLLERLVRR